MSNCEIIKLNNLDIEPYQVTDVLRCLLHTITFNRALGTVNPRDIDSELFTDLTWVTCGDKEVDASVESNVATVQSWVDKNPGRQFQVRLGFFEKRQQQGWWFNKEQRLFWEQWIIPFSLQDSLQEPAVESEIYRTKRKQALQQQIKSCLVQIITVVNEKRDHIPPVVSGNALTFPFEVTIEESTSESSSIFAADLIKRMLSSTQPPSVLH